MFVKEDDVVVIDVIDDHDDVIVIVKDVHDNEPSSTSNEGLPKTTDKIIANETDKVYARQEQEQEML